MSRKEELMRLYHSVNGKRDRNSRRHGMRGNRQYGRYRSQAKRAGVPFDIDFVDFEYLATTECAYCGEFSELDPAYGKLDLPCGVSRIDIYKGFVMDNLIPTCSKCAKIKRGIHSKRGHTHSPMELDDLIREEVRRRRTSPPE